MQEILSNAITLGIGLLPFLVLLMFTLLILWVLHKVLLGKEGLSASEKLPRQLILLLAYVISIVALVISLPIDPSIRNQMLALIGVLLSGVIAFSSTSIVSNLMAGVVMRITKPFRTGDFVRLDGHFGRVTERGLFDTEVQTEQRELIHFTNSYMLAHPLQVVRSSGTIISANLSLGYDLHHSRIEKLLIEAAEKVSLSDPFVQIIELGDFSISYRVSGLLTEVKSMISARSKLMASVLDTLHGDNIEIVSPSFMNQRRLDDLPPLIAKTSEQETAQKASAKQAQEPHPEDIIFDKAEEAESIEKQEHNLLEQIALLETKLKTAHGEDKEKLHHRLVMKQQRLVSVRQHKASED
ncbi:mechanosensitive ion channel family protein [Glaciecola siphonariae]|uniref:Small-conductance mechanosensitive channel n=1 Tax=Glaciecola siphonariae TaxID=521012 RepID=A0ABV9LT56_9ALTE